METNHRGIRELITWRFSECLDCDLHHKCTRSKGNLEICFLEDKMVWKDRPFEYLIKRTIRSLCAEDRRNRRESQRRAEKEAWARKLERYNAALFCADPKEFTSCRN